jgi:aldose 1-epimerase
VTIPEAEPDLRAQRRAPTGTEADGGPTLVLEAGDARLVVSAATGGRMRSFRVDGRELLVTDGRDAIHWGCFPMAPFAGRVRDGRFSFGGRDYRLPLTLPPHAIHGVAIDGAWQVDDEASMSTTLGSGWPFGGRVVQRFELEPNRLTATLELHAAEPMPGAVGWHPWFRRRIDGSDDVRISLDAEAMLRREADGIAGRERIAPTPGPWDDTFTGLRRPPVIEWPGTLVLEVSSTCPFWVVFDEEPQGICVEPQTEPPNELHHDPHVILPGQPLVATMTWRWWRPAETGRAGS